MLSVSLPLSDSSTVARHTSWKSGGQGTKEFCDPIYQALLGDLKKSLTTRKAA